MIAILLPIAAAVLLGLLAWEDFRFRAVSWWLFPLLIVVCTLQSLQEVSPGELWTCFLLNSCFLTVQLLLLSVYFSLRLRKVTLLTNGLLGLGDILFMLVLTVCFAPVWFITFHLFSLLLSLLIVLLIPGLRKNGIPLAGLQAFCLAGVWLFARYQHFSLLHEEALTELLYMLTK